MFGPDIARAARDHALSEWPHESCGVVAGGLYHPISNVAADPLNAFEMPAETWPDYLPEAVIHSHDATTVTGADGRPRPRHLHQPTRADMESQMAAGVPFGIVSTDGEMASDILWWGDHVLSEPLEGRRFVPGVYDCYALVRAWYFQTHGITLPDFARDDGWWTTGGNLLVDGFAEAGFVPVDGPLQAGDVFFARAGSPIPSHSGVLLADGLLLHHLDGGLSCRTPLGRWRQRITHWVRHAP